MPIRNPKYKMSRVLIQGAPAVQGVYALWDEEELIYLGRASPAATIRSRLTEHLEGRLGRCTGRATHYSWELSLRPAMREVELLNEFMAQFGRVPRCNEEAA